MTKKSAIMQMFYGKRGYNELVPCGKTYRKLLRKAIEKEENMKEKLREQPELLKLYEEAIEALDALSDESSDRHYVEGFRFGVLMGMDILNDETEEDDSGVDD